MEERGRQQQVRAATEAEVEDYLKSIYYDSRHPAGFAGAAAVYNAVRAEGKYAISLKRIREWLQKQEAYNTFRPARKRFPRPKLVVNDKDAQWDVDTLNMNGMRKFNNDYGYILVCIDVFTRHLITRPLKALTGSEVKAAFEDIFRLNEEPRTIRTDRGSEFVNGVMKTYFLSKKIHHFLTNNETKASHAERVIRTIRMRMGRLFKGKHSFDWVSRLKGVTEAYNRSKHRALGTSPLEAMCVTDKNVLWHWQYKRNDSATTTGPNLPFQFDVGDRVKASYLSKQFDRAYDERWGKMIYTITGRKMSQGYQMYKLKNWNNEAINGWFYKTELQRVVVDENTRYEVERVIKRRTTGPRNARRKEVLVKWLGWDDLYNSYIPESDLVQFEQS